MTAPIKRYLITGAAGQLGHELVRQLGESAIPKTRESLDLTDLTKVREIISMLRPDAVIHTATTNCPNAKHLFHACAQNSVPIMHISCDRVFENCGATKPLTEDDAICPYTKEGAFKAFTEHTFLNLCNCPQYWKDGFKCWMIRTGTLYERPWRQRQNIVQDILSAYEARRRVENLDVSRISSVTYIPHLAKALLWIADHRRDVPTGIYHIANQGEMSAYDVGRHIASGVKTPFEVSPAPAGPRIYTALDCSKFQKLSGLRMPTCSSALDAFLRQLTKAEDD